MPFTVRYPKQLIHIGGTTGSAAGSTSVDTGSTTGSAAAVGPCGESPMVIGRCAVIKLRYFDLRAGSWTSRLQVSWSLCLAFRRQLGWGSFPSPKGCLQSCRSLVSGLCIFSRSPYYLVLDRVSSYRYAHVGNISLFRLAGQLLLVMASFSRCTDRRIFRLI